MSLEPIKRSLLVLPSARVLGEEGTMILELTNLITNLKKVIMLISQFAVNLKNLPLLFKN